MMKHSSDGHRTIWHGAALCEDCVPFAAFGPLHRGSEAAGPLEIRKDAVAPVLDFVASLFDAPPPVGKYTREELEAQARAKRMAGPPRIFPVGVEACPDCGASFRPAPSRPSFGIVIMHKCGEAVPPPIASTTPLPRTYGDVYLSYNIASCGRCGASVDRAVMREEFSWAHTCILTRESAERNLEL
jgi:hypothetical protein